MLDAGGHRLVDWLAHEACVRRLKLSAVVGFRNGDYERAAGKLRGRPAVLAVWPRWLAGEGDLRALLEAELRRGGMAQTKAKSAAADNLRAVRAAGIDPDLPISPHSLRHTATTQALDADESLRRVQVLMGHRDPRTTTRYDRARDNVDRSPVHALGAAYRRARQRRATPPLPDQSATFGEV